MHQRVLPKENLKNLSFEKLNFFPSKNHLAFLTIERYDIELTNIKISDKNIVPPGGAQGPEGGSFYCYFEVLLILM